MGYPDSWDVFFGNDQAMHDSICGMSHRPSAEPGQ